MLGKIEKLINENYKNYKSEMNNINFISLEERLKETFDGRYSLFLKAGSSDFDSFIFDYMHVRYYAYKSEDKYFLEVA